MTNKALLPVGFHDLLFDEAREQYNIIVGLADNFQKNGYWLVTPPAIEFEESLFSGAGEALQDSTFRLMDPQSHKMMGVRADMTVQIARVASTRLSDKPHPLRLSYFGDVFRIKGDGLHAERQFTQAGIELIGVDNAIADTEVATIAIQSIRNLGIKDICIDFVLPGLDEILLDDLKLSADQKSELLDAIKRKDASKVVQVAGKHADLLNEIISPEIDIERLTQLKLPKEARVLCDRLKDVISLLKERVQDVNISVDPLEAVKFEYHSGIAFSIFAKASKDELGRGGRYLIENSTSGIGVTLYVNELSRVVPRCKNGDRVLVPWDISDSVLSSLHKDGLIVIRSLLKDGDLYEEAKQLDCKYVLSDGVLTEV